MFIFIAVENILCGHEAWYQIDESYLPDELSQCFIQNARSLYINYKVWFCTHWTAPDGNSDT